MKKKARGLLIVGLLIMLVVGIFLVKYGIPYLRHYNSLYYFEQSCYMFSGKVDYSGYTDNMVKHEIKKELEYSSVSLEELRKMVLDKKQDIIKMRRGLLSEGINFNEKKIRQEYRKDGNTLQEIDTLVLRKKKLIEDAKDMSTPHYDRIIEVLEKMINEK
jgi:hypothetical protein